MNDPNKENEKVKKEIIAERREILKYQQLIEKQSKKLKEYEEVFQQYISKEVELDKLQQKYNQCKMIEDNQLHFISVLNNDLNELREIYNERNEMEASGGNFTYGKYDIR